MKIKLKVQNIKQKQQKVKGKKNLTHMKLQYQ